MNPKPRLASPEGRMTSSCPLGITLVAKSRKKIIMIMMMIIIIYMSKLLYSDWLRAMQLKEGGE